MRKITLLAVAALSATSAMAVQPATAQFQNQQVKAQRINQMAKESVKALAVSRADEGEDEEEIPAGDPSYYAPNSFFTGMSNTWYAGPKGTMIAPSRGVTKFLPVAQYSASRWEWVELEYNSEKNDFDEQGYYAEVDTLEFQNFPYLQTDTYMTLISTDAAGATAQYTNPHVYGILCGRNYNEWVKNSITEAHGIYGVAPVAAGMDVEGKKYYIWGNLFGFDKSQEDDAQNTYNENGVSNTQQDYFPDADPASVKIYGYSSTIPSPNAPYQLRNIYFLCRAVNTEEASINVNVYEIVDGEISEYPIGKGSAVIAANTEEEPFYDYLTIELTGVNILGFSNNQPICTDKALYFEVTGMDSDVFDSFYMMVNGNVRVSQSEWKDKKYWRKLYPTHAQVLYSMTDAASGETVVEADPYIHGYYVDSSNQLAMLTSDLMATTDFMLYYDINFPQVFDAYTGLCEFEVDVTEAPETVEIDSTEDLVQLYEDGIITAEATGNWFSFEVSFDEENELTDVTVSAEALPAGVTGRKGYIYFKGYGCDFTITVIQGDGSQDDEMNSISSIQVNGNGVAEYYDLQGRKLNAAPAQGLYIERNGSAASKKIAK